MCANRNFTPPARPGKVFFSLAELKKLVESENSCISSVNCRRTITITPVHLKNLFASVKELLNSEVTKFDVELQGVVLAHKNIKIIASSIQLSDARYFPLEYVADIYVFKPKIGSKLTGVVNKIAYNKEYISVLVHNIFNVVVHSSHNQPRHEMHIGSVVTVAVTLIDFTGRIPYIKASIISTDCEQTNQRDNSCDENTVDSQETVRLPVRRPSILKNSPARLQSSTDAESSSAERDVANLIRTPGNEDVRKKKKKKKTNEKEVVNGEESISTSKKRKRTAEDSIEELTSPSKKKKKKDKHHHKDREEVSNQIVGDELLGSQSQNPLETTMQLLANASIFNAASSTPVLGPPQSPKKKKKKKKDKLEKLETTELNRKESAIQRSLKQLKTELRTAPGDSGISSGDERKSEIKKKIISETKSSVSAGSNAKSAKGDSSSVETDSVTSSASGKQNKKKKKVKKEKVDPMTAVYMDNLMNQALRSLKAELSE